MDIGFVGLGRMGLNMTIRLQRGGHRVVAWDRAAGPISEAKASGATGAATLEGLLDALNTPRAIWAMIPAGKPVDDLIETLAPRLQRGDLVVDGGNSNYRDSKRRFERMKAAGFEFVDAGVSGGIWGLENGYCLMLGGEPRSVARLEPALDTLAPRDGWRHVGRPGAGHFSKMVHNGIEYAIMQSYAEGWELLKKVEEVENVTEVFRSWREGTVIRSWLLDLLVAALDEDDDLAKIAGYAEDSGEGRWTVEAAIEHAVPMPAIAASLFARFVSRQDDSPTMKAVAALRNQFGGHAVRAVAAQEAERPA